MVTSWEHRIYKNDICQKCTWIEISISLLNHSFPIQILIDHNDLVELAPYTFTNLANLSMVNLTNNKLTKFPLNALTLDTSKTLSSDKSTLDMIKTNSKYETQLLWLIIFSFLLYQIKNCLEWNLNQISN